MPCFILPQEVTDELKDARIAVVVDKSLCLFFMPSCFFLSRPYLE